MLSFFVQNPTCFSHGNMELPLEEVSGIDDGEDEDGGEVDGQDGIEKPSLEDQGHLQTCVCVACILVGQGP